MKESKSKESKNKDFIKEIEEQNKVLKELAEKFQEQENVCEDDFSDLGTGKEKKVLIKINNL